MTDQRDEFYQPWLREPPAPPVKRRFEPETTGSGLARDEAVPLGVDVSAYVLDETPPPPPLPQRVKPVAKAAGARAADFGALCRKGAMRFADWTIDLGARADVPSRVAALEIPRRSRVIANRTGHWLASAARGALVRGRHGGAAAKRLADRVGRQAGSGLGALVAQGKAAAGDKLQQLRPTASPTALPPSGLDRLLETESPKPVAPSDNLPLFSAAPVPANMGGGEGAPAQAAPSSDERPLRRDPPPALGTSAPGGGLSNGGSGLGQLPRWWPWGAALLLLLAIAFWLGTRWGGGMDRAQVETIVRETLLANPEIVPEALQKHQANQMARAIDAVRPVLEKPFAGAWVGNAKGDVTLTVFTDYGCVFCRASVADVDRLVREDKGVKVVFRELPIIAPQSKDAAIAALAAARQGKYDAFHHAMFAAPGLDQASIDAASTRAGVILDGRSDANADTRLFEREIDNNLALAQQLGINATPTWFVGDQMLQGAVGLAELKKAVAAARAAD